MAKEEIIKMTREPTGTATVENRMEFPQKTKHGTTFGSSDPTAGIIS